MIAAHDAGEIALVVSGAAAAAAVVGAVSLRLLRKRSVLASLIVVAVTASVVVAAGTAVIGQMMLVSGHAFRVLMLVLVVSLAAGLAVAWLLGRSLTAGSHVLAGALREIGEDDFVAAPMPATAELNALSGELVAMQRRLAESRTRERALESSRRDLVAWVSHDLRTPLAGLTGMATALRDAAPGMTMTADQVDSLDTIVEEATRLGQILTNLLAITRVESGAEVKREWVPVDELIGAALGRAETVLAGRPVAIAIAPELGGDLGALVDPILIELLVVNLLENAAKHTPAGSPIDIGAVASGDDIQIDISDRGPGLPDGPEARLFDKFVRGPNPLAPGAGLGLAVCQAIAIAHRGRIAAIRRPGGGATFRLWLPGGRAPAALSSPADHDRAE